MNYFFKATAHLEPPLSAGLGPQVSVLILLFFFMFSVPAWLLKCRFWGLKRRLSKKEEKEKMNKNESMKKTR